MLSSLLASPNKLHFSASLDEYSALAEKAFNGDFLELQKTSAQTHTKNLAENPKIIKNTLLKDANFLQNEKQQLYWNRTSAWVFSCKFAAYFQNTFSKEHFWTAASEPICFWQRSERYL